MMTYETETHTKVYPINNYEEDIKDSKLPSIKQFLILFLHNHNSIKKLNETIHSSAT